MKKSKIILGCIISVMAFVLTLLIGLPNKVYASEVSDYIDENYSNLTFSDNLINEYGGTYDFISYIDITSTDFTLKIGTYTLSFEAETNNSFTRYEIVSNQPYEQGITNQQYIVNGFNSITFDIEFERDVFIRLWATECSITTISKIMLNQGSQALPYEPYITGSMIYNEGYREGLANSVSDILYKAFDGASVELTYRNSVIITDSISLNENDVYLSVNNIPNVLNYLNNDETSNKYDLIIHLNLAINNEIIVLLNNSILDTTLTLSSSIGSYRQTFSRAENSLDTIIGNSQGQYFDTIVYSPLYPPDYINFKLNLDASQLTYEEGYNSGLEAGIYEGYQQGSDAGYYRGYENGKINGYNEGYQDGSISNFETNGFKTLLNSILSYPVNLISNVLDFEFMGINIASLIMFIVSVGIVVFVVKKFW